MEKILARQTFPGAGKRPARTRFGRGGARRASAPSTRATSWSSRPRSPTPSSLLADARHPHRGSSKRSRERLRSASPPRPPSAIGSARGAQADVLRANLEVTPSRSGSTGLRGERRWPRRAERAPGACRRTTPVAPVAIPDEEPSRSAGRELLRAGADRSPVVAAAAAARAPGRGASSSSRMLERRPDFTATAYYAAPRRLRRSRRCLRRTESALSPAQAPQGAEGREGGGALGRARELSRWRATTSRAASPRPTPSSSARSSRRGSIASSILPQAETTARAAREAYTVGQIDFLTFVARHARSRPLRGRARDRAGRRPGERSRRCRWRRGCRSFRVRRAGGDP